MPIAITTSTTIPASEVDNITDGVGLTMPADSSLSFTLNGTLNVNELTSAGVRGNGIEVTGSTFPGPQITIGATGVLGVTSAVAGATGIAGSAEQVVNHGQITVSSQASSAAGVVSATSMNNSGTITVTGASDASGVGLQTRGSFVNSGHIQVTGANSAIGVSASVGGAFVNTGTIEAAATGPASNPFVPISSTGVNWGFNGSFSNAGVIKGDTALATTVPVIDNSGQLIGKVVLGSPGDLGNVDNQLNNSGTITGSVDMGTGDDTYSGAAGVLQGALHGGDGNDLIRGGAGAETLSGDLGNDTVEGGGGADVLDGGAGTNLLSFAHATGGVTVDLSSGHAGAASIANFQGLIGSAFGDNLTGTGGADSLAGGAGADTLTGSGGGDTLDGGAGQDLIVTGGGARIVIGQGESGADPAHADVVQDWSSSDALAFAHAGQMAGDFLATSAPDLASAQAIANAAIGAGLKNFVAVQVGADVVVFADSGNDNGVADDAVVLKGRVLANISVSNLGALPASPALPTTLAAPIEPAAPSVAGTGAHGSILGNMDAAHLIDLGPAILTAASGADIAAVGAGGLGFDLTGTGFTYDVNGLLIGGLATHFTFTDVNAAGATLLQLSLSLPNTFVGQFETWLAFDQTQLAFQTILAGSDVLAGGVGADLLHGYDGNDLIAGGGGSDSLFGGTGDDVIYAGLAPGAAGQAIAGTTFLRGEDGNDYIVGGAGFDDINGNKGEDTIDGGSGGNDWLVGGQGNDLVFAHTGQNILYGNLGNDTLVAGAGVASGGGDLVRGGQGDDVLFAGAGNDWLSGDRGNDTITGGAGADIFHTFSGAGMDRVLDFHASEGDRVQVDLGTSWTVTQVGADTVIDMGAGDQMVLVGVQMSTLPPGWIFVV